MGLGRPRSGALNFKGPLIKELTPPLPGPMGPAQYAGALKVLTLWQTSSNGSANGGYYCNDSHKHVYFSGGPTCPGSQDLLASNIVRGQLSIRRRPVKNFPRDK